LCKGTIFPILTTKKKIRTEQMYKYTDFKNQIDGSDLIEF